MASGDYLVSKCQVQPFLINQVIIRNIPMLKTTEELKIILDEEKEPGELKSWFVSMAFHKFGIPLIAIISSVHNILMDILNDFLSQDKFEVGRIKIKHGLEKNIIHRG